MADVSAMIEPVADSGVSAPALRRLQRLAAALAVVAIALALVLVRLGSVGDRRFALELNIVTVAFLGTIVLFPLVGSLIVQRRPATRVAWLMIAMGLALGVGMVLYGYGTIGMPPRAALPGALPALVVSQLFFVPTLATGSTLLFLLFPTDRLLGPRWRIAAALSVVGTVAFVFGSLAKPGALDPEIFPGVDNPIGFSDEWGSLATAAVVLGNGALIGGAVLGALTLVLRYRSGDRIERAQIRWVALVGSLAAVLLAISALQIDVVSDAAWDFGLAFLSIMPIAIGVAITRYHLYDIDRLINRTLVYGALTAILAGIFTAGIGLAQRVFVATTGESSDAAIVLATLVVATLYAPLRKRLEAVVDRRFKYEELRFGAYRDEVVRVLGVLDPTRAAQRLVTEAVRELEATGGAVVDATGGAISSAGDWPVPSIVRLPIPGGQGSLVALLVGPRIDGRPHDPRTIAQLEDTVGLVVAAVRLGRGGERPD